jgi:D-serine deaminase-like pyridoxal phosphate-dependent protein
MSTMQKGAISAIGLSDAYQIAEAENLLTPALAVYADMVESNISATLRLLEGDCQRWRPHIKTAKLASVIKRFTQRGITNLKCATLLELLIACEAGASDVLLAYPVVGANAKRVRQIAEQFPLTRVSVLIEDPCQIQFWAGSKVSIFIDINPGMNRTGIDQDRVADIVRLARAIGEAGLNFRGLHYYDGHLSGLDLIERERVAHQGYDQLMKVVGALESAHVVVAEVITAGTPTFPCTLSYKPFADPTFIHRASPGTLVYCDLTSLKQLPAEFGYRPAAIVISAVVSHPTAHRITCDAGHKTVSADAGVPTCAVLGRPELEPLKPSEEHLPILALASARPRIGEILYLLPRHICPTVNNFDHAIIVVGNRITGVERVSARGRLAPL